MVNLFKNPELDKKRSEGFNIKPYSILNTTSAEWLRRKSDWISRMHRKEESILTAVGYEGDLDPVLVECLLRWFTRSEFVLRNRGVELEFIAKELGRGLENTENRFDFDIIKIGSVVKDKDFSYLHDSLKKNRFIAILLNEERGDDGCLVAKIPAIVLGMEMVGFKYYNEICLSNGARKAREGLDQKMDDFRMLGIIHSSVLIFYKGEVDKIKEEFGKLEYD